MQYPSVSRAGSGWLSADTWFMAGMLRDRDLYLAATMNIVETRIGKKANARKDITSYLLSARDRETDENLSFAEVWSEAYLMLSAGSDTTATAMSATFFYLSSNPECLAALTQEVRSAFPDIESIYQGHALHSCTYLRACLAEAMRMSHPIPGVLWREILAGGFSMQRLNDRDSTTEQKPTNFRPVWMLARAYTPSTTT